MPLEFLLPLVVVSLILVVLALRLLLPAQPRKLRDPVAAWLREYPDRPVRKCLLDDAERTALVLTEDGSTGLVWLLGDDTTARALSDDASFSIRGERMTLNLGDFSAPRVTAYLADEIPWIDIFIQAGKERHG